MRILLMGPPGVGKGTQASLLESKLQALPISSGAIFRAEIEAKSELGALAKQFMEKGALVPDEVTIGMIRKRLQQCDVAERGYLLDGFPRTLPQAEALDVMLADLDMPLERAVALEVDDEMVVRRISGRRTCPQCGEVYHVEARPPKAENTCDKCGHALELRSDDQPETIRERLRVYHERTKPVLSYYEAKGILRRVDSAGSADEVFAELAKALDS